VRKSKYSEEQIALALRQAESGTSVEEVCRRLGISQGTFFRWKKQFGSLGVTELRELRQLREENRKLKQLVADRSLDRTILNEALRNKW
jgi:putative transposase